MEFLSKQCYNAVETETLFSHFPELLKKLNKFDNKVYKMRPVML